MIQNKKPLGRKSYGSIPHLPESRTGPSDRSINDGQSYIATVKCRSGDTVIVEEKLDGSNVGIANIDNRLYALNRKGYEASTSTFEMHHLFDEWVKKNTKKILSVIKPNERICGEWLTHAHGTRYDLPHEPFVAFDIISNIKQRRMCYDDFIEKLSGKFTTPYLVHKGSAFSVDDALDKMGPFGKHGAIDAVEGAVWRVERNNMVIFLCKYVQQLKVDGCYLNKNIKNTFL